MTLDRAPQPSLPGLHRTQSGRLERGQATQHCRRTAEAEGHVTIRTFDDEDGLLQVTSINIAVTLSADGNDYTVRDVGADVTRMTPDGVAILSIIGQVPFEFTGVLKLDLDTGEAILEPQHSTQDELDEVCQVLGG